METRYQEKLAEGTMRCIVCPRMCTLTPGQRGFCGTKENQDGSIVNLTYGLLSAIAVDPIEKKPLAHFYPGSLSLSISSVGCSFTCPWCQNWHLSTAKPNLGLKRVPPDYVVDMAHRQECTSISYTYNEPLINLDYVEDTARLAKKEGVKNVLVTNGYISGEALGRVVDVIDAANVDWKGFTDEFYKKHCSADLQSVLDATVEMHRRGVHVEVTFLIIPETNDSEDETRRMARYLHNNMGSDVPLHLSRFYPQYRFSHLPPTPVETLLRAREIVRAEGIHYVYVGNVPGKGYEDTVCPNCGETIIKRVGYKVTSWDIDASHNCKHCGKPIPVVGDREEHL
ncbi:MAG: AmmeMemoRadiSam system radical SAM enzyme [Candidatus Bathyarchaeota archaeon]|nr:AmmeMemoRadiSam system radical SAM enzyme [Candidatus Bathyarchaeota archaeon]